MKNNPRIERLKEMLNLEEKRVALQQQLDDIMEQMTELRDALFANSEDSEAVVSRSTGSARSNTRQVSGRRGALKDRIMAALEAAGSKGVYVKELSQALGTKPVNIHSWFHSSIKRYPAIKKLEGGHYRLEGNLGDRKSTPSTGNRAAKSQASKGKAKSQRGKRGELSARILGELENAGAQGISVRDLADKLDANYRNIYIWFATTGKKNGAIKKVGPAQYRLGK